MNSKLLCIMITLLITSSCIKRNGEVIAKRELGPPSQPVVTIGENGIKKVTRYWKDGGRAHQEIYVNNELRQVLTFWARGKPGAKEISALEYWKDGQLRLVYSDGGFSISKEVYDQSGKKIADFAYTDYCHDEFKLKEVLLDIDQLSSISVWTEDPQIGE